MIRNGASPLNHTAKRISAVEARQGVGYWTPKPLLKIANWN